MMIRRDVMMITMKVMMMLTVAHSDGKRIIVYWLHNNKIVIYYM